MISTVTNIAAELTEDFVQSIRKDYDTERAFMPFNRAHFTETWQKLIDAQIGAVWTLKDGDTLNGVAGAIIMPEPIDGANVASLAFWFVPKKHCGSYDSTRLFLNFELWAATHKADRMVVAVCYDTMGGVQDKYLGLRGFKPYENRYYKQLSWESLNQ